MTAPAVAAGAVAKKWLRERYGVVVRGYLSQLGPNRVDFKSWDDVGAEGNPFFVAYRSRVVELEAFMDKLRKSGDSCGARLTVVAAGVPAGWGEPLYGRLDADIAQAMMGINAVKGVEIGAGFRSVEQLGTEHSDEMTPDGFLSNNAGGILGGFRLVRTSSFPSPSNPLLQFACRDGRSTSRGMRRRSSAWTARSLHWNSGYADC